jgi:hypothetical protein
MPATDRQYANGSDGVVVFLIGMRINRPWKVHRWWPPISAMPRMLRELGEHPELGLLHARTYVSLPNVMVVQYWESEEKLAAFARDASLTHLPAWKAFNREIGGNGDVGIWHETYVAGPESIETVYRNMPRHGLAAARGLGTKRGFGFERRRRTQTSSPGPSPDPSSPDPSGVPSGPVP